MLGRGSGMAGHDPGRQQRPMSGRGSRGPRRPGGRRLSPSTSRSQSKTMLGWLRRGATGSGPACQDTVGGTQDQSPEGRGGAQGAGQAGIEGDSRECDDFGLIQDDQAQARMDMGVLGLQGPGGLQGLKAGLPGTGGGGGVKGFTALRAGTPQASWRERRRRGRDWLPGLDYK